MKSRGKRFALAVTALGIATMVISAMQKDRFIEWWYTRRLRSEDENIRNEAILALAAMGLWRDRIPLEGIVEAVKLEDRLVVLSVGRDQAVEEGQPVIIFRKEQPVALVKTTKVYENLSGARIRLIAQGRTIQIGDRALLLKKAPGGVGIEAIFPPLEEEKKEEDTHVTIVQAVNAEDGIAMLGAGTDEEVEVGQEFAITREDKPIGKVKVIRAWEHLSSAKVSSLSAGEQIQAGDHAHAAR